MVERFNERIADLLRTPHFRSGEDLEQTLRCYVTLYNHHLPGRHGTLRRRCRHLRIGTPYIQYCFIGNPIIGRGVTAAGNSDDGFGGKQPTSAR